MTARVSESQIVYAKVLIEWWPLEADTRKGPWIFLIPRAESLATSHESLATSSEKMHNKNPGQVPLPIPMRAHPEYGAGAAQCTKVPRLCCRQNATRSFSREAAEPRNSGYWIWCIDPKHWHRNGSTFQFQCPMASDRPVRSALSSVLHLMWSIRVWDLLTRLEA